MLNYFAYWIKSGCKIVKEKKYLKYLCISYRKIFCKYCIYILLWHLLIIFQINLFNNNYSLKIT